MRGWNYGIKNPAFKSLKVLHTHSQNGWGAEMVFALQWSCFSPNCIFVLLCTCWQHWSSYHLQGYLIRIIWFNGNWRQFQLQMYQNLLWNLQMLLHSVSLTEYTDKLKKNLLQIWTRELCASISVNTKKKSRVHFQLWVFKLCCANSSQACVPCKQVNPPEKIPNSMHCIRTAYHFFIHYIPDSCSSDGKEEEYLKFCYMALGTYIIYYYHRSTQRLLFSWTLALYDKNHSRPTLKMIWVQTKAWRNTLQGQI